MTYFDYKLNLVKSASDIEHFMFKKICILFDIRQLVDKKRSMFIIVKS